MDTGKQNIPHEKNPQIKIVGGGIHKGRMLISSMF